MPSPSHHVELAVYEDDTAVIATFCQPALPVKYMDTCLSDLERWLREWRIAIDVSKSSALLFAKAGKCVLKLRPHQLTEEPVQWVDTMRFLGVNLDHGSPGRPI